MDSIVGATTCPFLHTISPPSLLPLLYLSAALTQISVLRINCISYQLLGKQRIKAEQQQKKGRQREGRLLSLNEK